MTTTEADEAEREPSSGRRPPVRLLSAGLFVLLVVGSIGIAVSSRRVVNDQEHQLLDRRAAEVGALLTLSGSQLQSGLQTASKVIELTHADPAAFADTAKAAVASKQVGAMAIVQEDGAGGYRIVRSEGPGLGAGRTLGEPVLGTLRRAGSAVFSGTPVFEAEGQRRLGYALLVPNVTPRTLVYAESVLLPPAPSPDSKSALFGDLVGAVYTGDHLDPAQLVLSSPGFQAGSGNAHQTFKLGADPWVLEVSAKHPLVGNLARRQPWLYLIGGLLAALLVAALVEVLLRRRRFADELVDERTAQLRQSLTELDAAQHRLVHQERLAAIGQLASAVGHELRNPLGVLSNVFYLLGQRLGHDDDWVARQLSTGEREVAAATLIVSDLLEYSKPRQPIFEDVDVALLVEEVLGVAPPPNGVEIGRRLPPGLPPMRGDRPQLRQVLLNLVSNAYDAMPNGGLLVIEGESVGDTVRLTVSDTGGGIGDDVLPRLFEPFFTTKAKGIGLGLSVAHRIMESHGGSLEAASRRGTGASFTMSLSTAVVPAPSIP